MRSHDYARPQIEAGHRLHGGFLEDGRYVPPRALVREPAMAAWRDALRARGGDVLAADSSLLAGIRYPNAAQLKLLLQEGLGQTFWNTLTITGRIEARGRVLADMSFPEFADVVEEDTSAMAVGHLNQGLLRAHGLDEGGEPDRGIGGHDVMWFALRDLAFGEVDYPEPEVPENIGRPESEILLHPDVPEPQQRLAYFLLNLLLIEFRAERGFSLSEELLRDPELFVSRRAEAEHAAEIVGRIRADEEIHVSSLRLYLGRAPVAHLRRRGRPTREGRRVPRPDVGGHRPLGHRRAAEARGRAAARAAHPADPRGAGGRTDPLGLPRARGPGRGVSDDTGESIVFRGSDGVRLRADAWGDPAARPVLLQHGGGQTRHAWGGTAKALARAGWYAVALDLRGHGESDWSPAGDYAFDRFADDTIAVARALGRPAVVGASLGGLAGLLANARADGPSASHLVLVDVTPRMNPDGVDAIKAFMADRVEEGFASLEEAADAVARYLPHRPRPRDTGGLRKNLRRGDDGRWRWHWDPAFMRPREEGRSPIEPDALEEAARMLAIPTLLVRGRMSELVEEEHARDFLAMVPHARYADVSGAGHMVAGDRNDAFTDAVVAFLEETSTH